ncbi:hypothetical protein HanPI659440_Chr05g0189101 [Helianthus annuus]|nr:hypothetical protein HanPI659440_Chr05g0189101 [Helianthus annuus]
MSDKWPRNSIEVPVFLQAGVEIDRYHQDFPACSRVMGVRPLREGEELLYEQIRVDFMYPTADAFSMPPTATKGAQFLNPQPRRAITPVGEEVILLSSKESSASRIMG